MPSIFDKLFGGPDYEDLNSGGIGSGAQPKYAGEEEAVVQGPSAEDMAAVGMRKRAPSMADLLEMGGANKPYEPTPPLTFNNAVVNREPSSEIPPLVVAPVEEKTPPSPVIPNKLVEQVNKYKNLKENPTQNPPPVSQVLSKLTGNNGRDEMADAMQQRNSMQLLAILGRAGQQAGAAIANKADLKPDDEAFRTLLAASQQPVSDIGARNANEKEGYANVVAKAKAATEAQKSDPNSAISQTYRDMYEKTMHKKANPNMSASELESAEPIIAKIFNAEQSRLDRQANREIASSTKQDAQQSKSYSKATQAIMSFRGNSGAQQSSRDVLSAEKALALLNQPGMKTTQDLQIIADELGKIALGGVPGEHGVKALMPDNLKTKYAQLKNFITSKPTDAQATEYLARNKEYLQDMNKVATKTLYDYQMSMAKGFKKEVGEENYNELVADIKGRWGMGDSEKAPSANAKSPSSQKPQAGSVIVHAGKRYKVGADGDSLEEIK